jgi:hypothetical protein
MNLSNQLTTLLHTHIAQSWERVIKDGKILVCSFWTGAGMNDLAEYLIPASQKQDENARLEARFQGEYDNPCFNRDAFSKSRAFFETADQNDFDRLHHTSSDTLLQSTWDEKDLAILKSLQKDIQDAERSERKRKLDQEYFTPTTPSPLAQFLSK